MFKVKKLLKQIYSGIGMGCFTFVATLFLGPVFAGGTDRFFEGYTGADFQRSAICFIVISLGFFVPALIYGNEKISSWLRTLVHMLIGTTVFILTAYFAGWMKSSSGVLMFLLIAAGVAAIWWLCIFLCLKAQARKMNQKIKEKQQDE